MSSTFITTARKVVAPYDAERFALQSYQVDIGDLVFVADTGKLYAILDTGNLGSNSGYLNLSAGGGGSSAWGDITGTLSSQTDLQAALDAKFSIASLGANVASFLATPSSANLRAAMTDGSGTGALIFAGGALGAATATSINGNVFTAGTYTLTGVAGKTLTFNNSITLAGTDSTVMTFPTTSATLARTDAANTFTGASAASAWVLTSPTITTKISPTSDDGAPLGDTTHNFSDLFLATGAVINFANSNVVMTHTSGVLTLGTGNLIVTTAGTAAGSVVTTNGTQTLSNKRTAPRITTISSSATPTVNTDNTDSVTITALAAAITSMSSSLTGSPTNFDTLTYRIKDDGTARAITWGASFASRIATLPTTTVSGKVLSVVLWYNSVTSTWDCMASGSEA